MLTTVDVAGRNRAGGLPSGGGSLGFVLREVFLLINYPEEAPGVKNVSPPVLSE
jgi:hypothetical protein